MALTNIIGVQHDAMGGAGKKCVIPNLIRNLVADDAAWQDNDVGGFF